MGGPVVGSNDATPFERMFDDGKAAIVDRDGNFAEEIKVGTATVDRDDKGRPTPGRAIALEKPL